MITGQPSLTFKLTAKKSMKDGTILTIEITQLNQHSIAIAGTALLKALAE